MCMAQQSSGGGGGQTNTAGAALGGAASGASMGAMLGPWGAAVGAVGGAAMGVFGSMSANKAAKANEEARRIEQDRVIAETRKRATDDYLRQVRLETLQQTQEVNSVSEKSVDLTRQRDSTVGTAVASAAERGVGGRTVEQIVADYHFQSDQETGRLLQNQAMKNRQHSENMNQFADQFGQRVNSQKPYQKKQIGPVDYFSPIFGAVGDLGKIAMASGAGKTGGTAPASGGGKIDWETTPVNPEEYR